MAYLVEIIDMLETVPRETVLKRGFTNPHSWRGVYSDLALEPSYEETTVGEMIDLLKSCVGATFEGWKGGSNIMNEYTDVHIAEEGSSVDYTWDWLIGYMIGKV